MVNSKTTFRKNAARVAAFLVALSMLFNSFPCFAYNYTDNTSYDITDTIPSTVSIVQRAHMDNYNVFFFWDINANVYYLISVKNFFNNNNSYQFIYGATNYRLYSYKFTAGATYGERSADAMKAYRFNPTLDTDWTEFSESGESSGITNDKYFDTTDCYLYAFYAASPITDQQTGDDIITYINVNGDFALTYINPFTSKYYFNPKTFELSLNGGSPDNPDDDNNSGLLNTIISWLSQIKDSITNLPTNLSSFFTNLGSSIGGFFDDLWTDLELGFTQIKNTINHPFEAPDGFIYLLGQSLGQWFTDTWNYIKAPFEAPDGFIYLLGQSLGQWFTDTWNNIKAPFEAPDGFLYQKFNSLAQWFIDLGATIKGFFIPDDTFWETYRQRWNNFLNSRFGGLISAYTLSFRLVSDLADIFFNYTNDSYSFDIPPLVVKFRDPGNSPRLRKYTIYEGGTFDLFDLFYMNGSLDWGDNFDPYTMYELAVNAVMTLTGLYHLKRIFDELIGRNEKGGF